MITPNSIKKNWNIDKADTSWRSFSEFSLVLTKPEVLPNFDTLFRIKKVVEKLAEVSNVKNVRAIALKFPDIHWIDFELQLQPESELSDEDWNSVQDLVIDCEWKLRDDTGEKWYFNVEPLHKFPLLRAGSRVINLREVPQISASNLNLVSI